MVPTTIRRSWGRRWGRSRRGRRLRDEYPDIPAHTTSVGAHRRYDVSPRSRRMHRCANDARFPCAHAGDENFGRV